MSKSWQTLSSMNEPPHSARRRQLRARYAPCSGGRCSVASIEISEPSSPPSIRAMTSRTIGSERITRPMKSGGIAAPARRRASWRDSASVRTIGFSAKIG